jgi:hypothetical protein
VHHAQLSSKRMKITSPGQLERCILRAHIVANTGTAFASEAMPTASTSSSNTLQPPFMSGTGFKTPSDAFDEWHTMWRTLLGHPQSTTAGEEPILRHPGPPLIGLSEHTTKRMPRRGIPITGKIGSSSSTPTLPLQRSRLLYQGVV